MSLQDETRDALLAAIKRGAELDKLTHQSLERLANAYALVTGQAKPSAPAAPSE